MYDYLKNPYYNIDNVYRLIKKAGTDPALILG